MRWLSWTIGNKRWLTGTGDCHPPRPPGFLPGICHPVGFRLGESSPGCFGGSPDPLLRMLVIIFVSPGLRPAYAGLGRLRSACSPPLIFFCLYLNIIAHTWSTMPGIVHYRTLTNPGVQICTIRPENAH